MGVKKHFDKYKIQVVKEALETDNLSLVERKYNINPSMVAR